MFLQVVTTTADLEVAERIAKALVEQQLAACVQIVGPIQSIYRWEGQIEQAQEYQVVAKTRSTHWTEIAATIAAMHPYDVPEIIAVPIAEGSDAYVQWLEASIRLPVEATLDWYDFEVSVFARPDSIRQTGQVVIADASYPVLDQDALQQGPLMPVTFEQVLEGLATEHGADAEPDGYFLLIGDEGGNRWQIDGHLYDRDNQMWRLDLHGKCPRPRFDAMLRLVGWPSTSLVFQLVQEGITLDEAEFRRRMGQN